MARGVGRILLRGRRAGAACPAGQVVDLQAALEWVGGRLRPVGASFMIDTLEMDMAGVLRLENRHHVHLTRVDLETERTRSIQPTAQSQASLKR